MFSKEQIEGWLALNAGGENDKTDIPDYFSDFSLKVKLIESKVLVDRWNLVTTLWIVHSSHKEFFREKLGKDLSKPAKSSKEFVDKITAIAGNDPNLSSAIQTLQAMLKSGKADEIDKMFETAAKVLPEEVDYIWGAEIHYSDDIPVDKGLAVAWDDRLEDLQLIKEDDLVDSKEDRANRRSRCVAVFPMGNQDGSK